MLGSSELDWAAIGAHFGRSARAAQAHYQVLTRASGAKPTAGSAAVAAAAGSQRGEEQQVAARCGHSTPEAGAGQHFSRNSGSAPQPVRAAITIGLPPQAEQHESPPFVGVEHKKGRYLPWAGKAVINGKACHLASCAGRAGAAAAYDVARMWCKLHGQGDAGRLLAVRMTNRMSRFWLQLLVSKS